MAIAAAQQAELQNAITLIQAAINSGLVTVEQANNLTPDHIGEIGILETPEQVGVYIYQALVETAEQRAARREQARGALQAAMAQARQALQERTDQRVNVLNDQRQGGKSRRRRRTRKSRK